MKFHWSRALGFFRQGTLLQGRGPDWECLWLGGAQPTGYRVQRHNFAQHGVFEHAARKKQVSKVALVYELVCFD